MLDHLRLAIPVIPTHVRCVDGKHHYFNGDIRDFGLPAATRHVGRADDGSTTTGDLYHPYESLPSDYTDMAMKFYANTMNTFPYVEIKASPLKLLQGHNVYGFESIHLGATEMLGMLADAYPQLLPILDFENIEVLHLDTTYFVRLPHQNMVQPVLDYMSNISVGHRKAKQVKYDNYITWGNEDGRYIRPKAYGKFEEVKSQLSKIQKQADKGCMRSKALVLAMHDALKFSNACLRFEARICKTYLTKNGYPSNLWKLIDLQRDQPSLLAKLWHVAFDPIFGALKGENMNFSDDGEILELLRANLFTITKSGKKSTTKADNAFKFYCLLRQMGWESVKAIYKESTFYDNVKALTSVKNIDRGHLQNLHKNKNGKVIPFTRLIEIKFEQQLPPDYQIPVSKYADKFGLVA
ncbi:phage/plasmid replication protein, II/X family [Acinetobacter baumannii]|uniref:phage/plasmid replication protein, II/X family n=2 Tax=Acinetobacter baumannii TaxID=470 RepID=UPI0002BBA94C|nr:phage/plasmid replication protein, II/X family [Acinetobacter baumannii]MDC4031639.1 phage/plasmid replication protein, II/X family [Acinetobacter baumannii]MDC4099303.1 phage/plasmid replication protein, II/X family [Acinetobacter baumannii]MDC4147800.1 phage/plasmid replication protein, II/X family [Acinetobacter baumannii]MDC4630334.1 phage/plasmid replication protein, II/X family [Acinetobacter baumannii]MDC5619111.1 phage/plasmid replication protein, II/X family [Acinetobacter baumanni